MAEDKFEQALITKLQQEGWEYRKDLSNVSSHKLMDHWREILNKNNYHKLDGKPISDNEFDQLKERVQKISTPYEAQLLIAGAGGVGTIGITRDDGSSLEVEIFYEDDVAGGKSIYEVVNQITFNDLPTSLTSKRRIDVMLLINGLPVAHVEEKDENLQNQWNAFEQLKGYAGDGMYTGLFSFVQVQFTLSQHSAHYMARPSTPDKYNKTFVFGWRDDKGKDVTDTMVFVHQVMGIPALHRLVTVNMIPNESEKSLLVMRSYQIQATRAILDRVREMNHSSLIEKNGGYIWHTTGSGKTVTSFKVAQLLVSRPEIKNVLFIVDRVDLVKQTYENFKDFAYVHLRNRIKQVNGSELKKALNKKDNRNIFLISVQGLDKAVKRGLISHDRNIILMDEAHRSASGDAVKRIKDAFTKTTWFGFTGTPNFYSSDDIETIREISTYDIFGPRLHQYTIKDAIADGNVLGFDISYYKSVIVRVEEASNNVLSDTQQEKQIYQSLAYRESVVKDILDNWDDNSSGPIIAGSREKNYFQAMLAVSGKQAVVAYYNIFQRLAPDLRVAMTFSKDEDNSEGSKELQQSLKDSMEEYSANYGLNSFFNSYDPEKSYFSDVIKRVSRKSPYNRGNKDDILDLLIVSDQLLTGFDSKYVNMIYLDKILKEGPLIQAMSRTNRTIDRNAKPYGKVRFYRKGDAMKEYVRNALTIYTHGGNDSREDSDKNLNKELKMLLSDNILARPHSEQIKKIEPDLQILQEMAGDDFSQIPKSEKEREEFVKIGAQVNEAIQRLVQQGYKLGSEVPEFDESGEPTDKKVKLSIDSPEQLSALQARLNDVNQKLPDTKKLDFSNVTISLENIGNEIINYDTLTELVNNYISERSVENKDKIEKSAIQYNSDYIGLVNAVIEGINNGSIKGKFTTEALKKKISEMEYEAKRDKMSKFAKKFNIEPDDIEKAYEVYRPGYELTDTPDLFKIMSQIEDKYNIGFLDAGPLEEAVMSLFKSI